MPTKSNHVIVATLRVEEQHRVTFLEVVKTLAEATLLETGCLDFELHLPEDGSACIMIYEVWQSKAHWETHMATAHIAQFKTDVASFSPVAELQHFQKL